MPSILFVCTGNLCRSPLAAALFRARVAQADQWRVDAAGIHAQTGLPPPPRMLDAAAELGIDLRAARSRRFESQDFAVFDNIVAMDRGHLDFLRAVRPPAYAGHIDLLHDSAGRALEIPDPYGRPLRVFRLAAARLVTAIEVLSEELAAGGAGRWMLGEAGAQRAR